MEVSGQCRQNRGAKNVQALPGRSIYTDRRPTTWGIGNWTDHHRSRAVVSDIVDSEGNRFKPLSGLFSTFWLLDSGSVPTDLRKERAYYVGHKPESIGELTTRDLPNAALFWLAVGCLPFANGDIYVLDKVENLDHKDEPVPTDTMQERRARQLV
jgi:hypothetical protein